MDLALKYTGDKKKRIEIAAKFLLNPTKRKALINNVVQNIG